MRSTLLQIVQQFCNENGLPAPAAVVGAADSHSIKLLAQVRKVLRELLRYRFPAQNVRVAWTTTVAGEDQGNWRDLVGDDMQSLSGDTFWDETTRLPIKGPLSPVEWQQLKALPAAGACYRFTIKADRILIHPAMPAGRNLAISYYTGKQVYSSTGELKSAVAADTDTFFYSDAIMIDGMSWCWRKAVGEEWESEYELWLGNVAAEAARDGGKTLSLSPGGQGLRPGIVIPLWRNS